MDRRQQKTRRAIFRAFHTLLEKKRYDRITVQEIIDEADVGRSTFYAHFETKELLLDALCNEVFFHVLAEKPCAWDGDDDGLTGRLTHVLWHIRDSQRNLAAILLSESGDVFMSYFKRRLQSLFEGYLATIPSPLPSDYRLHQLAAGFAETVKWWAAERFRQPPEEVAGYFVQMFGLAASTPPTIPNGDETAG